MSTAPDAAGQAAAAVSPSAGSSPLIASYAGSRAPRRIGFLSAEAWSPMRYPLFAGLWIATLLNYIGTAARDNMGSPWLMKDLAEGRLDQAILVGRVTSAATLPLCLLSVFAGTLADLFDRRRLLIATQLWMVAVSIVLGVLTWFNLITPWGLLGLTLLLAIGTAASNPAFQAVLPELVPPTDISLAMGLNSVALNLARAAGPAMFMTVMALWHGRRGIAVSFLIIALTFVGVTVALYIWKRPPERAAVKGERFWGALRAGLRYTAHSPANRAILLRVFTFIVPALALWSQLPILAKQVHVGVTGFSILMVCLGAGAVLGVFMMQELQRRFSIDGTVNACTAMFAAGLMVLSQVRVAWLADIVMFFLGINWVIIPTNFNVATQTSVPGWVKGRALSMYLTVLWGSFALGGELWGRVTAAYGGASGLPVSLFVAGVVMAVLLLLAKWFPLTLNSGMDFSPGLKDVTALRSNLPLGGHAPLEHIGPIAIAVQYSVGPAALAEFLPLMREIGQQRRRNGASSWRFEASDEDSTATVHYIERFTFRSMAECERQAARMTATDVAVLQRACALHTGAGSPAVNSAPAKPSQWLKDWIYHSVDRGLEEFEIVLDRFSRHPS